MRQSSVEQRSLYLPDRGEKLGYLQYHKSPSCHILDIFLKNRDFPDFILVAIFVGRRFRFSKV